MFAIVLVGGFGTRLRPLTEHVPKQMLPICGVPMIEWVVGHLADHGVEKGWDWPWATDPMPFSRLTRTDT